MIPRGNCQNCGNYTPAENMHICQLCAMQQLKKLSDDMAAERAAKVRDAINHSHDLKRKHAATC